MATGTMSNYLAHMVLNASLGTASWTAITNVYLTLSGTTITATDTSTTIVEPSETGSPAWTNFARKGLASGELDAAASRAKASNAAQSFGTAITTGGNVSITQWAVADVAAVNAAGNLLWYGDLQATIIVQNNNPVSVPATSFKIAISATQGTPP